jgi:hypothetical protein
MPLAPPVIKIVLPVSFIIKYPNYVTIYKVARKLSIDRQNILSLNGAGRMSMHIVSGIHRG